MTHFKVFVEIKIYSSMHSKFDFFGIVRHNNSAVRFYDILFWGGCFDLEKSQCSVRILKNTLNATRREVIFLIDTKVVEAFLVTSSKRTRLSGLTSMYVALETRD